jgi:hypothetical protein
LPESTVLQQKNRTLPCHRSPLIKSCKTWDIKNSAARFDGQRRLAFKPKEKYMNRSVLLGLFVTASLMASPSFAAEDLCAVNLKTIENGKAQIPPEMADQVKASVEQAKADQAKGTKEGTDDCIAETNDIIKAVSDSKKGGK